MAGSAAASRLPTGRPAKHVALASRCAWSSTISSRRATCGASPSATRTSSARCAPRHRPEQYSVFRSYLDARHRDGGMADMTVLDYAMMIEDSHVDTRLIEYRHRGP